MSEQTMQVAVITGGASGIGYALASALAHRGCRVALADISDESARDAAGRAWQRAQRLWL
jgi:NAD(P)-dependent dehydrogenase (short-subunit alcohol dehydrogenase family)